MIDDIGNIIIQTHTKKKFYTKCGLELGDRAGSIAIIIRALYGLTTSAERFRAMLADFCAPLGSLLPTLTERSGRERNDKTEYDYICAI